jgi:hypothetical protein
VHIDQPLLNHEPTEGQCEIEDGPALAIETARRLACDGSLVGITEGHHVNHWAGGGETKLENLVTLCHFHHHLVHEGSFGVHCVTDPENADTFVFTRPDGEPVAESIRVEKCFRGNNLTEISRQRGIDIDATTIDSRWLGETMDYSLAIDALIAARDKLTHSAVNGSP